LAAVDACHSRDIGAGWGVTPAEKALSPRAYVEKAYSEACACMLAAMMKENARTEGEKD
jgi:hypothetical protein